MSWNRAGNHQQGAAAIQVVDDGKGSSGSVHLASSTCYSPNYLPSCTTAAAALLRVPVDARCCLPGCNSLQPKPSQVHNLKEQLWGPCAPLERLCLLIRAPFLFHSTLPQVHNLNAVKQQLWGLEMEAPCLVGDTVEAPDGTKLGKVTSYIDTPSGAFLEVLLA